MSTEERKNIEIEDEEEDDSEDDDYIPSDNDEKEDNESIDNDELDDEEQSIQSNNKQDSTNSINSKQLKSEEEKKRRADELWNDLCMSSKPITKKVASSSTTQKSTATATDTTTKSTLDTTSKLTKTSKPDTVTKIKEYDFAGEKIKIAEEVKIDKIESKTKTNESTTSNNRMKRSLGINGLVANLGKKAKLSTLSKTKLDWDMFKQEQNIVDELKNANKNKNSFVDREAFLQRTDLKQFELEKAVREKNRTLRN